MESKRDDSRRLRLLHLLEHAPVLVAEVRADGTLAPSGGGLDLPLSALEGAHWLRTSRRRVVGSGAAETLEVQVHDSGGSARQLVCRLRPTPADDGAVLLLAHENDGGIDLTLGLDLFGVLAASVAHDINNPLAAAIANLDLALDSLRSGTFEVFEELGDARDAAERVRLILRDLRLFSGADLAPSGEVDVAFVVQSAVRIARSGLAPRARIVESYGDVALVEATDSCLGQAFLTVLLLVGGSIPEGRLGEHELYVSVDTRGDRVEVNVGSSVPGDVALKGPSLQAVRRVLDGYGGQIEVDVSHERPPRVRIELPAWRVDHDAEDVAPAPPAIARRGRVLSVDDEPAIGMAIRRILGASHDVVCLASAEAALSLLARGERFDVLLCDVMMPGMTGIELFEVLSRDYPEQAERVIFLTGGAHSARASTFLKAAGVLRLEKPFDYQALRWIVNQRLT